MGDTANNPVAYRPLHDHVIVQVAHVDAVSPPQELVPAAVLAVGPDVDPALIKVGDVVLCRIREGELLPAEPDAAGATTPADRVVYVFRAASIAAVKNT